MFKVLDEDLAMMDWWASPHVQRINFLGHLNPAWFAEPNKTSQEMFFKVNPEIVTVLTGGSLHLLKFTGDMRYQLLLPVTPRELYGCVDSSWSITLTAVGLFSPKKCSELAKEGANTWIHSDSLLP
mmetsp:Transcript_21817/g.38312  ORF Transcript_21817/g.38312 Transcript_21817/m.38312 type:complete len:126 (+) Transcript_21817:3-380(+)